MYNNNTVTFSLFTYINNTFKGGVCATSDRNAKIRLKFSNTQGNNVPKVPKIQLIY